MNLTIRKNIKTLETSVDFNLKNNQLKEEIEKLKDIMWGDAITEMIVMISISIAENIKISVKDSTIILNIKVSEKKLLRKMAKITKKLLSQRGIENEM